jgi:speckle-type POZ protein
MENGATASICNATLVQDNHQFVIAHYSLNKEIGVGNFIRSRTFQVDEYEWSIRYYPDGFNPKSQKHISIIVELMSENAEVRAMFSFRLVSARMQSDWKGTKVVRVCRTQGICGIAGCDKFMKRSLLEAQYLDRSDSITIECAVAVVKDPLVFHTESLSPQLVEAVPPSGLSNDFANLLGSKEGADVTFSVQDEAFPAHRAVLAARSPVFKAQLCGPMKEKEGSCMTVEDMLPDVFGGLLHFIYTDMLPPFSGFDEDAKMEVVRHLLGAADRYAIERLKLICETILCSCLDVETVASTYALADLHGCNTLKEACLKFMASPNTMAMVMASQDYETLKTKSASLAIEILEGVCKLPKV